MSRFPQIPSARTHLGSRVGDSTFLECTKVPCKAGGSSPFILTGQKYDLGVGWGLPITLRHAGGQPGPGGGPHHPQRIERWPLSGGDVGWSPHGSRGQP